MVLLLLLLFLVLLDDLLVVLVVVVVVTSWAGQDASELFPSLPSIESLCSKVLLKARTELFKVVLVHLATRLSSSPTNDR